MMILTCHTPQKLQIATALPTMLMGINVMTLSVMTLCLMVYAALQYRLRQALSSSSSAAVARLTWLLVTSSPHSS